MDVPIMDVPIMDVPITTYRRGCTDHDRWPLNALSQAKGWAGQLLFAAVH